MIRRALSLLHDALHERAIRKACLAMLKAPTRDEMRACAARMAALIRARSANQVERMERKKGLL